MKQAIAQLLIAQKGNYISGEEISKLLAVSRTAVWKHINSLKEEGYQIVAAPRRGYCLVERPDILSMVEIKTGLETKILGQNLLCFPLVDSTNEVVKREAAAGAPEGTVVVAEQQEQGKGRLGRQWVSLPAVGLWFSVLLRPEIIPAQAAQLTFVSAVAVCRALRAVTGLPLLIKWPNDILLGQQKVCGILTELSAEIEGIDYVVAGIGINVNQQLEEFPPELRDTTISLALAAGHSFSRAELLRKILQEYEEQYRLYLEKGFAPIRSSWRKFNATLGKEVLVSTREGSFTGVAEDINEDGCLLIKKDSGEREALIAGDVSLRGSLMTKSKSNS